VSKRLSPREIVLCPDVDALSRAAADVLADVARAAVAARGRFAVALSGGMTPRTLYRLLAAEYRELVPWAETHVFFGDERCVGPSDPDSNYRMARAELLERIPGLASRTERIEGERPAEEAAARYDAVLREAFPADHDPLTTFDLLLLGVGTDGHTASLFPGSPALEERDRWAIATEAPPTTHTRKRVTLTYPVLNAARTTLVLCAGADKRAILHDIMTDPADPVTTSRYPAARITARERLVWMVDRAAHGEQ
jgi:6-phosphogluconolactonase